MASFVIHHRLFCRRLQSFGGSHLLYRLLNWKFTGTRVPPRVGLCGRRPSGPTFFFTTRTRRTQRGKGQRGKGKLRAPLLLCPLAPRPLAPCVFVVNHGGY